MANTQETPNGGGPGNEYMTRPLHRRGSIGHGLVYEPGRRQRPPVGWLSVGASVLREHVGSRKIDDDRVDQVEMGNDGRLLNFAFHHMTVAMTMQDVLAVSGRLGYIGMECLKVARDGIRLDFNYQGLRLILT